MSYFKKTFSQEKLNILSEKFLVDEYINNKKSISIMASEVGCSHGTIHNWLKKYNINRRKCWDYRFGFKLPKEERIKISIRQMGKNNSFYNQKHTRETKNKISRKGSQHGMYGKKHTKETKRKISLINGGTGIPYEYSEYSLEFDNNLKEKIRFRDKYKCRNCGCSQLENGRQLDVHHIDYNKQNCEIINLVALCIPCHRKTNANRKCWKEYYNALLQKSP